MNALSFASLPFENVVNFYKYYSYFTFILSWLIAPLIFYVVLTQSKNLKAFKWLTLNHIFWCLTFQTFAVSSMPVILSPALAGYSVGWLLNNGSPQFAAIIIIFLIMLIIICIASSLAILLCRYMLVFPFGIISKYLNKKHFITATIICAIIMQLILVIGAIKILNINNEIMLIWIQQSKDPVLYYLQKTEICFIFIPLQFLEFPLLIAIIYDCVIITAIIFFTGYFIYLLKSLKVQSANASLKRSLLLSGIVQMLLVFLFLFLPMFLLLIFIRFHVANTSNAVCMLLCAAVSYSFIEFITTLCIISPYRKFVKKLYYSIFRGSQKPQSSTIKIISSSCSTTEYYSQTNRFK